MSDVRRGLCFLLVAAALTSAGCTERGAPTPPGASEENPPSVARSGPNHDDRAGTALVLLDHAKVRPFASLLPDAARRLKEYDRRFEGVRAGSVRLARPHLAHPTEAWLGAEARADGSVRYSLRDSPHIWIVLREASATSSATSVFDVVDGRALLSGKRGRALDRLFLGATRRMEEFVRVESETQISPLRYELELGPGLDRAEEYAETSDIVVVDESGDWRLVVERPEVHDAAGRSVQGRWRLRPVADGRYLIEGELAWEGLTFPVLVDPTVGVPTWIKKSPPVKPPPLRGHSMTFDSARDVVVLFGGGGSTATCLNTTWEWDGTTWTSRGGGPGGRQEATFVYDPAIGKSVLFSGHTCPGDSGTSIRGWDGTSWSTLAGSNAPQGWRYAMGATYDSARSRTVIFGNLYIRDDEVYEYEGNVGWSNPQPSTRPQRRGETAMFFDTALGRSIIFSGNIFCCPNAENDTWGWDGSTWVTYAAPGAPSVRSLASAAYDTDRQVGVLWGGKRPDTCCDFYPQLYEWHDLDWHAVSAGPGPNGIYSGAMAYDAARKEMVFYGGVDSNIVVRDETWVYAVLQKKTNGEPCDNLDECASKYCVDGVCCATTCGSGSPYDCQACSIAKGGSSDGTCTTAEPGTLCRPSDGNCDIEEVCDGGTLCPTDLYEPSTLLCRPSAGDCDIEEYCSGSSRCPDDNLVSEGTECRASDGLCDPAEACDGESADCPDDTQLSEGDVCRPSKGACDPAELCDGADPECPEDELLPAGDVCRAAISSCDPEEECSGDDPSCPSDVRLPNGAACDDGSECTKQDKCAGGLCSGTTAGGVECPGAGECEVVGECNEDAGGCPTAVPKPDGEACSVGACSDGECVAPPDGEGGMGGVGGDSGDGGNSGDGGSEPDGGGAGQVGDGVGGDNGSDGGEAAVGGDRSGEGGRAGLGDLGAGGTDDGDAANEGGAGAGGQMSSHRHDGGGCALRSVPVRGRAGLLLLALASAGAMRRGRRRPARRGGHKS